MANNSIVENVKDVVDLGGVKDAFTFAETHFWMFIKLIATIGIGFVVISMISHFVGKMFTHYTNRHVGILIKKFIWYGGWTIITIMVISQLGYNISTLLGAAGVLGVAFGLASQTSLSNIVSGIFLLSEVSFKYNDLLTVGDIKGYVSSIDLLAVKLKTSDNRLVRIPNEFLIKTIFTNETYFPTRRYDFSLLFQSNENIPRAMSLIEEVVKSNKYAAEKPDPFILFDKIEDTGLRVVVGAWAKQDNLLALKQTLLNQIKERFEQENITFSYPQLEVNLQSPTDISPQGPR